MNVEKVNVEKDIQKRKKRSVMIAAFILLTLLLSTGCSSCDRCSKTCSSDFGGGLNRTIKVYSQTGELIAEYEGVIDIEDNDNKVLFDLNGKRIIIYNALVITEEK